MIDPVTGAAVAGGAWVLKFADEIDKGEKPGKAAEKATKMVTKVASMIVAVDQGTQAVNDLSSHQSNG